MEALVLREPGAAVLWEMEEPRIKSPYGAKLSPIAMSVCTSDINTVYGSGSKKPKDLILGHECVARIEEVGEAVRDFRPGDVVVVPSMTPDWRHIEIQEGNFLHAGVNFSANALGRSIPGVFARYFTLEDADMNLALLPEGVSVEEGLMCVDMVTTGFSGAEAARIQMGDTVLVIGIGPVGLMALSGAVLSGAGMVIGVGSRSVCKKLALRYGATHLLDYKREDWKKEVFALTEGRGADAVIVCGGGDAVLSDAVEAARYGIGRVVNLKHFPGDGQMGFSKFHGGRGMAGKTIHMELGKGGRVRMERLLRMVRYKRICPGELVTHRYHGFSRILEAMEGMRVKDDAMIKTALVPEWA